jgi:hypothetical protein
MKLKYLNPNVVFVMSGQSGGTPLGSEDASLTVQLLDSVSGQLLYRQTLEVTPNHYISGDVTLNFKNQNSGVTKNPQTIPGRSEISRKTKSQNKPKTNQTRENQTTSSRKKENKSGKGGKNYLKHARVLGSVLNPCMVWSGLVRKGKLVLTSVVGTNPDPSDAVHLKISFILPFASPGHPRYP